jgi:AcrR family transcriptional regulator
VPANRQAIDRDQKANEILDAAERLFLQSGFDHTTVAALASAAGVAGNTIYWYFDSKDDLLAAIMNRRLDRVLVSLPTDRPLPDIATAALTALDEFASLTAAVHERAQHSPAVANAHQRFHLLVDRTVQQALRQSGLGPADARLATMAIVAMVEGIHLHDQPRNSAARDELVQWVLTRFTPRSTAQRTSQAVGRRHRRRSRDA